MHGTSNTRHALAVFSTAIMVALTIGLTPSTALADNDKGGGQGKGKGESKGQAKGPAKGPATGARDGGYDARDRQGESSARVQDNRITVNIHFDERRRDAAREYYGERFRAGACPPGLAKKNNGCMPPGQAKQWSKGRPLARDVIFYDVPDALVLRLGPPPSGHRYVRVAADILLIAIGTAMVVDAIQDLGNL